MIGQGDFDICSIRDVCSVSPETEGVAIAVSMVWRRSGSGVTLRAGLSGSDPLRSRESLRLLDGLTLLRPDPECSTSVAISQIETMDDLTVGDPAGCVSSRTSDDRPICAGRPELPGPEGWNYTRNKDG